MSFSNLGYTFYRNIDNVSSLDFGQNIIETAKNVKVNSGDYFELDNSFKITFKTVYPGLAIGLGYVHDSSDNDDFKLGFLFDYTTGLPYIPGSSIKGTIRSMFPVDKDDSQRINFINTILNTTLSYDEIYAFEKSVFGKSTKDTSSIDNTKTKDIFHDGYFGTTQGGYLSSDYITPHKNEITSPDPLKFLKISPDTKVTLQFTMNDNDFTVNNVCITKKDRIKLYTEILTWTGLSAKTNVGYGVISAIKYEDGEDISTENIEEYFKLVAEKMKKQEEESMTDEEKLEKEIKTKFKNLDIKNEAHKKSFINKYENEPLAQSYIEKLIKKVPLPKELVFDDYVLTQKKYKQLDKKLKDYIKKTKRTLTDIEKEALERHLLSNMENNSSRYPYAILNDEKVFGRDKTAEIKEKIDSKK